MANLKGKTAVVTGAGHGIGKGIAVALAQNGSDVVVTDLSDEVFSLGKELESMGSKAFPVKCDVTNSKEAQIIEEEIVGKYQRIDILVNNAGIYPQKPFLEMTTEDWSKVLNVNLNGVFHCTKAVAPKMVQQRYGKIINIASIAGAVVGYTNLAHYSASKAAIVGLTRSLALELAPYGINVNAIAPGAIDVGMIPHDSEMLQQVIKTIPIGRMGVPADIANLAVFLGSDESSYITGQCIVCDGGYTIP